MADNGPVVYAEDGKVYVQAEDGTFQYVGEISTTDSHTETGRLAALALATAREIRSPEMPHDCGPYERPSRKKSRFALKFLGLTEDDKVPSWAKRKYGWRPNR